MKPFTKLAQAAVVSGLLITAAGMGHVPVNAMDTAQAVQAFEQNSLFSVKELAFKQSMYVLDHQQQDVNGDGVADELILVGHKEKADDLYATDITLVVKDGKTKAYTSTSVGALNGGYEAKLLPFSFDPKGPQELLIAMENGGSGGTSTYSLIRFTDGKPKALVDQTKLNEAVSFEVAFQDQFQAQITNKLTKAVTTVDISEGKQAYIEQGIYNESGKLLKPTEGAYDGFARLEPKWQPDGSFLLEGEQKIWGSAHADTIATATSTWKVENGEWKLVDVEVLPFDWYNQPAPNVEIDKPFTGPGVKANTFVLDSRYADVTGDGVRDEILLIGYKEGGAKDIYTTDIQVVVRDGKTKQQTITSVGESDGGYGPSLFIGNFNGDKAKDVLVSMATGGSGGTCIYSLLSFNGNKAQAVVDQKELNEGLSYDVKFLDQFKVELVNKRTKEVSTLDISSGKDQYIEMGIYDKTGKLLQATEGMVDGFGVLEPKHIGQTKDGIYELRGLQFISGAYHADGLATVVSTWAVDNGKLKLLKATVVPLKR